ncbi:Radical SAM superfamily enzyme [Halapricum desulfuricans]|uniref:Radical SAM superfamily enzyme n=1 Tax=Halapricum desulfuricans TaxID=2841257 RepID=A0A897NKL0_9EURY|nr:Radical SAM superfamily enzyme [Halapricum desulfuricans]
MDHPPRDSSSGHPGPTPSGSSGHPGSESGHPGSNPSGDHPGGSPMNRDFSRTPLIVTWEVTQACGLECDHCRAEAQPDRDPEELTTEEGKRLLESVADFGHPPPILVFSGGDPLERPDLDELVDYASELGLPTAVTPAPTQNLTREVVQRFADAGIHRMALSLDGPDAESHDEFRGEEGSYERVQQAAQWAADAGLSIQINTTVTANTAESLPEIAEQVEDLGAAMWEVFFLVPIGRGAELDQLAPAEADEWMAWLYRRQREAPFRLITVEAPQYRRIAREVEGEPVSVGSTRAGSGFVFVSHRGEVYPSGFLPESAGNVRDTDLVSLYRDSDLFRRLRDTGEFSGRCGRCPYRELCGGSRSRAYAVTGDPFASDPLCPLASR